MYLNPLFYTGLEKTLRFRKYLIEKIFRRKMLQDVFTEIYENNTWEKIGGGGVSKWSWFISTTHCEFKGKTFEVNQ